MFHQDFRIFTVYIVDILDQLIVLFFAGGFDQANEVTFRVAGLAVDSEQDTALVLAVVCLSVGSVAVPSAVAIGISITVVALISYLSVVLPVSSFSVVGGTVAAVAIPIPIVPRKIWIYIIKVDTYMYCLLQ